jgi:hypothetical protein
VTGPFSVCLALTDAGRWKVYVYGRRPQRTVRRRRKKRPAVYTVWRRAVTAVRGQPRAGFTALPEVRAFLVKFLADPERVAGEVRRARATGGRTLAAQRVGYEVPLGGTIGGG